MTNINPFKIIMKVRTAMAAGCELLGDLENAKNAILAEVEAELDAPQEEA